MIYGPREDVYKAKLKAIDMTKKKLKHKQKEIKGIVWQYEEIPNKWKDFSVDLNAIIESKHSEDQKIVKNITFFFFYINKNSIII